MNGCSVHSHPKRQNQDASSIQQRLNLFHFVNSRVGVDARLGSQSKNFFFGVNGLRLVVNRKDGFAFLVRRHALRSSSHGDNAVSLIRMTVV